MIDIHSHIIFDVDDGPATIEESIALIEEAYSQGVRQIISTSHRRKGMFETSEEKILANFNSVKEVISERMPDLKLHYGGELYYSSDVLQGLDVGKYPCLANTRFALIEFSSWTGWKDIHSALNNVLMLGITPIVAHIERYNTLENDKRKVQELIDMGCYIQINSSSVLKPKLFGDKLKVHKKRARYFLENDLVHFIASDMHNTGARKPFMKEAYDIVSKDFGVRRAERLFKDNQSIILMNEFI